MWDASIAFECGGLLWGRSRTMAALIKGAFLIEILQCRVINDV